MQKENNHPPLFRFVSGKIKGIIESILFSIIGVEPSARKK